MNVCIVSTFEGTTEDYMEMFNATKEKGEGFMADYHIGTISCLLYTSPSPRDAHESRMPSSA